MKLTPAHLELLHAANNGVAQCFRYSMVDHGRMPLNSAVTAPTLRKRLKELAAAGYLTQIGRGGCYKITTKGKLEIL